MAYGTWHLGGSWDRTPLSADDKRRGCDLIAAAVDLGINHLDLADIYTRGKSDEAVGEAMRQQPGLREQLVLQAKCGIVVADNPHPGDPGRYDFTRDHLVASVEGTLRRLGTDRVELLALHRPDPLVEPEEVARAFHELHASGKVRYFGVSNHTAPQIELLKRHVDHPLVLNQLELSLLHHDLITDGILANRPEAAHSGVAGTLDYCRLHEIMIQAWSPVARGRLFDLPADAADHVRGVAAEIVALAASHQTKREAIAVGLAPPPPGQNSADSGTLQPARLAATARADEVTLSRCEWYRLLAAARGAGVP